MQKIFTAKLNLLILLSYFLCSSNSNAQFAMSTSTTYVSKTLFFDKSAPIKFEKKLQQNLTGENILLLIPNSNKKKLNELINTYRELGCKKVIAVMPPKYPSSTFIDSVKQVCADSTVKLIAQFSFVNYKVPFFVINFSKLKRGDNFAIVYTAWDPEEKKYKGSCTSTIGQNTSHLIDAYKIMMPASD